MPLLEDWKLIERLNTHTKEIHSYLSGKVFGHEEIKDGRIMFTHRLSEVHPDHAITVEGVRFDLGKPFRR